jgi:mono/diheme cytochrome c family protein
MMRSAVSLLTLAALATILSAGTSFSQRGSGQARQATPATFNRDVLPILQEHCQTCHRADGIGPMPLETYEQVAKRVDAIARKVASRAMPPWFADPRVGDFANDPSLSSNEIALIKKWTESGAQQGDPHDAPAPRHWAGAWTIPKPDVVLKMSAPVEIPAHGDVEYTYEIVPTGFTEDKWAQISQVLPSGAKHVHHAVVYIRPPGSQWLRGAPVGTPFTASSLHDPQLSHQAHWTDSDMLLVYAPGSSPDNWPDGMAKFIPAGSDLIFQMHYTTNGTPGEDQTSVGIVFAKNPPEQRVITLQLTNDRFEIPPGEDNFPVEVHGTLPNDATLLSFFPHMHLRGKAFEYNIVHPDHSKETLLHVNYNFYWQLSYKLAKPLPLKAGTELQAIGVFDNSKNNPHNPDPTKAVRWGDQTYEEMMVGFFDIAVPASLDKQHFFIRQSGPGR